MSALGALFFSALGISKIKEGIKNTECMSKPLYKTEKGYDVYMDLHGREYINGIKVYRFPGKDKYRNNCTVLTDDYGNIYSCDNDKYALEQLKWDEKYLEIARKNNKGAYEKYHPEFRRRLHTEIATGKPIYVWYIKTGNNYTYYKAYFHNGDRSNYDEQIEISYEEFRYLN